MHVLYNKSLRRLRALAVALLYALLATACETAPAISTQPESQRQPEVVAPVRPSVPGPSAAVSANIDSVLQVALARIALRQEAEQPIYDSLKIEWQRVLDDTTGLYRDSLMCDPKQYVATAKIVGPDGADINFGEHTLRIPSGALTTRTVITAEAPTSLRALAVFSPHGTQFVATRHPTLELSYKHCKGPVNRAARIAYIGSNGTVLEWPPSQDFPELGLVRGIIGHFSNYIVAY